jgi:hypothetical protein
MAEPPPWPKGVVWPSQKAKTHSFFFFLAFWGWLGHPLGLRPHTGGLGVSHPHGLRGWSNHPQKSKLIIFSFFGLLGVAGPSPWPWRWFGHPQDQPYGGGRPPPWPKGVVQKAKKKKKGFGFWGWSGHLKTYPSEPHFILHLFSICHYPLT